MDSIGANYYNTDGVTKLGIEQVGVFLTRGILLDIPCLKGKSALEKGYEITDQRLESCIAETESGNSSRRCRAYSHRLGQPLAG